ncbi:MAG: c-type cytochrome [Burkholderiaceae bacterium]|nr:c-type cytochrome [Burkholderiaceae bacterium]
MKRWFPIVAAAFLIAGCDNSNDNPPAAPQASSGPSAGSARDDQLVTGPRGAAETLPPANPPAPGATGDSGRDTAATKPKDDLSKQQEQQAMPKPGQANNHSSEALSSPGTNSGSAPAGSTPGGSTQAGSTQLAQSGAQPAAPPAAQPAAQPVTQEQALALMKKHNCSACHAVDKKLVGPSYKEVAAKYKGDPSAEAKLVDKVVKGGSGVWGPVPMPPHPTVPKEDIKAIVDWILAGAS